MIETVVMVGLAAGYLTWLLVDNSDDVPVWGDIVDWWIRHTKEFPLLRGKPFTCSMCMSFWLSTCLWGLHVLVFGGQIEFVGVCASAAISLWYVIDLNKRTTIVVNGG